MSGQRASESERARERESDRGEGEREKPNSLTSLSERCLASSSVEGTPSAVVASDESHIKVRTPRHPSVKPRRPREMRAGADSVAPDAELVAAAAAEAEERESEPLRPFFDALPSPPPSLNAVDDDGPAGEKSPPWAAVLRMGERGEEGIERALNESCSRRFSAEATTRRRKSATSRHLFSLLCPF